MLQTVKFFLLEEWKGKYAIAGAFLHIFTAVLITFLALPGMDKPHFSAIFWVVVIFTTLQGISKAFISMRKGSFVFWQQLVSPTVFLGARLTSAFLLMLAFTLFAYLAFTVIHGSVTETGLHFLVVALFTGAGVSSVFCISSSIAVKTDNPGVLLTVLTFPVIIPVLLIGVKAGKKAVDELGFYSFLPELLLLTLLDLLIIFLGLVLIKYIWKE
jgi:heme exporter protein B